MTYCAPNEESKPDLNYLKSTNPSLFESNLLINETPSSTVYDLPNLWVSLTKILCASSAPILASPLVSTDLNNSAKTASYIAPIEIEKQADAELEPPPPKR